MLLCAAEILQGRLFIWMGDYHILYQNPPTNQINLPQLIRSHKKPLNPPTIRLIATVPNVYL